MIGRVHHAEWILFSVGHSNLLALRTAKKGRVLGFQNALRTREYMVEVFTLDGDATL